MTGRTHISERAVNRLATYRAGTVPGVVSTSGGIVKLGGAYPRCDAILDRTAGRARLDVALAVTWPSPVSAVAAQVRDTVRRCVEDATGLTASTVNVSVDHVIHSAHRVGAAEVAAAPGSHFTQEVAVATRAHVASPRIIRLPSPLSTKRPLTPVRITAGRPLAPVRVIPLHPDSPGHAVAKELAEERRTREHR